MTTQTRTVRCSVYAARNDAGASFAYRGATVEITFAGAILRADDDGEIIEVVEQIEEIEWLGAETGLTYLVNNAQA